jgi:thiol-disulfide isomerase/thioredoxin
MAARPRIRPRLLVGSLVVAVFVSLAGGWALGRSLDGGDVPDDIVLDVPGEYQQPLDAAAGPLDGQPLPAAAHLVDATGAHVDLADLVGRPLVINVWYSTCPPCERELADFAAVHRELGDRVRFVGINPIDDPDVMASFAAERGVGYELLRDPDATFVDGVGLVSYPTTLFVDERGVIVSTAGVVDADELRARIEAVF